MGPAQAQAEWTGAEPDDDWFTPGNWNTGAVPTGTANAVIDTGELNSPVMDDGATVTTGDVYVGRSAVGVLTIQNGGRLFNRVGYIGHDTGSEGTVLVTGIGSTWTNSNFLAVGFSGIGTLTIAGGGNVSAANGYIGNNASSVGTVTVTGAGSTWINSGQLRVGYSNNSSGTLTIEAGGSVLNTSGYIGFQAGSNGTVTVSGAGSTWTNSSLLYIGTFGIGTLTVADGGSVSAANGYIGNNASGLGTVTVTGAGSTWTNSSALYVGRQGNGTLTIADGGLVRAGGGAGTASIGSSLGRTGTLNIGARVGSQATAPGTLEAANVTFGPGSGSINFNHTGTDYTFAPTVSGVGDINVLSGNTILSGNSSAFSGDTSITGGSLGVTGTLGGSMTISGNGTLGGTGTVGTTIIGSGGTIAPGMSIGTLTVDGDLTFNSGSSYEVEVDPTGTTSDLIMVLGTAYLNGGSVVHIGESGNYRPEADYTILTATGGIVGEFDGVTSNYVFLDPTLIHEPNDVILRLVRNDVGFASFGTTANQMATANALDTLGLGNSLHDAITLLSGSQAPGAFDQLSGEMHTSGKTALINSSARLRSIIMTRINSAFGDQPSPQSLPLMGFAAHDGLIDLPQANRYGAWGQVYGSWGNTSATPNTAALRQDEGGFLFGADGRFDEVRHGGVFGGYSRSSFSAADRLSSGSSNNYHLGIYGGAELGAVHLNAGAVHGWHAIDTARTVAFPGFTDMLTASYSARTMQVFGEAAYRMEMNGMKLEPFAGLAHVHLRTNGFTETGGAAALTAAASTNATTFSTFGIRAAADLHMGDMKATARGMVGWRHAFGDTTPTSSFAFAGSNSFAISGAPITRNVALVELGLDVGIGGNASLGVSYDGQFGKGSQAHSANARLGVRF